jgi:hypothetical protein
MGRGVEDGGFFDRSLRCPKFISNDRSSAPKNKEKKRDLISHDIFSLSRYISLVILLFFFQFSVA